MGLLSLIALLAVIGFVVWLVTTKIPMPDPYRRSSSGGRSSSSGSGC